MSRQQHVMRNPVEYQAQRAAGHHDEKPGGGREQSVPLVPGLKIIKAIDESGGCEIKNAKL